MEQIYEIEPLLKAGVCIQIHPQGTACIRL